MALKLAKRRLRQRARSHYNNVRRKAAAAKAMRNHPQISPLNSREILCHSKFPLLQLKLHSSEVVLFFFRYKKNGADDARLALFKKPCRCTRQNCYSRLAVAADTVRLRASVPEACKARSR